MSFAYVYSLAADMPGGAYNEGKLTAEIDASAIATALSYIQIAADVLTITFASELSAGDKTILDNDTTGPAGGLLAAHDNTASQVGNALRYSTNAGQSISHNTLTIVDFEDQDFGDDDGHVTIGAAWKYTVPSVGRYWVSAVIQFANLTVHFWHSQVHKNQVWI